MTAAVTTTVTATVAVAVRYTYRCHTDMTHVRLLELLLRYTLLDQKRTSFLAALLHHYLTQNGRPYSFLLACFLSASFFLL